MSDNRPNPDHDPTKDPGGGLVTESGAETAVSTDTKPTGSTLPPGPDEESLGTDDAGADEQPETDDRKIVPPPPLVDPSTWKEAGVRLVWTWLHPRNLVGIGVLVAFVVLFIYMFQAADSWDRKVVLYDGALVFVGAAIGAVLGVGLTAPQVKSARSAEQDAKTDRQHAVEERDKALQEQSIEARNASAADAQLTMLASAELAESPAGAGPPPTRTRGGPSSAGVQGQPPPSGAMAAMAQQALNDAQARRQRRGEP